MGHPASVQTKIPPGFVKNQSERAAENHYVDGDKVRFFKGLPEKVGGWVKFTAQQFIGVARGMHSWNTLKSRTGVAVGTSRQLDVIDVDSRLIDITPADHDVQLTGAFTTVQGNPIVTVNDPGTKAVPNQGILFDALDAAAIGAIGAATGRKFYVLRVLDGNSFTFDLGAPAPGTATRAGQAHVIFDIPPGVEDPAPGTGYGVGYYGVGTYGTERGLDDPTGQLPGSIGGIVNDPNLFVEPYYWSLCNAGQLLLGAPLNGKIYKWDPTAVPAQGRATLATGAGAGSPGAVRYCFFTPERFLFALGASTGPGDTVPAPMTVAWPDQNTLDQWDTTTTTGTANRRTLTEGKKLIAGTAVGNGVSLVWTDTAVYTFTYTGSNSVYNSLLAGRDCGLAGPFASVVVGGVAYWFGFEGFWAFAGGGVRPMTNADDIRDWVLENLKPYYDTKTVAFYVPKFNEVWWLFVDNAGKEPGFYAAVNLTDNSWVTGTLARTAFARVDGGWDHRPLMAATDGWVYSHETGHDADGQPMDSWLMSAPFPIQGGDAEMEVMGFFPDFARQVGAMELTMLAQDRTPEVDQEVETATYQPGDGIVDLRMCGRYVAHRIRSNVMGGDWRGGAPSWEVLQSGGRR